MTAVRTDPDGSQSRDLSFVDAHRTLRGAQKPNYGAPAYSRWVNRPLGRVLAATAYRLGLSPNHVTAISAVFSYAGIAVVALVEPSAPISALIAVLLLVGYALDSADGQLARLTSGGRPSGEWLDHVIDMGKLCLLHGAIAISWIRWGVPGFEVDAAWGVAVPVLFLTVTIVGFFAWLLSDLLVRNLRAGKPPKPTAPTPSREGRAPVMRSLLRLPGDYGLLALTFVWFSTMVFAVSYVLLLVANAAILLLALPVWFGQVRTVEEST